MRTRKVLFVCSRNRLRSPTAEQVFSRCQDLEVASAGTNNDADTPLTSEMIAWADIIVVMEKVHRSKVRRRFGRFLASKRIVCLDIPDKYQFMDPSLVRILEEEVSRLLPQ